MIRYIFTTSNKNKNLEIMKKCIELLKSQIWILNEELKLDNLNTSEVTRINSEISRKERLLKKIA